MSVGEVRHVGQHVARPAADVAAYIRDAARLPEWAAGLAGGIRDDGGRWVADSPMGEVEVVFAPENDFGVVDHWVTLPDGSVTHNPVRAIPDGDETDVVFTVRHAAGVDDAAFEADVAHIAADLATLREVLESRA